MGMRDAAVASRREITRILLGELERYVINNILLS